MEGERRTVTTRHGDSLVSCTRLSENKATPSRFRRAEGLESGGNEDENGETERFKERPRRKDYQMMRSRYTYYCGLGLIRVSDCLVIRIRTRR
jgi:hypothetical protein